MEPTPNEPPTDLITPKEVAKLLNVSGGTVRRWIASSKLPAFRVGGRIKVSKADALAMVSRVQPRAGPAIPTRAEVEARAAAVDAVLRRHKVRR